MSVPNPAAAERCKSAREAARHKRQGWKLHRTDPDAAVAAYEKAHELCPNPWYLGHMAAVGRQGGFRRGECAG